jgi:hypothetical protein
MVASLLRCARSRTVTGILTLVGYSLLAVWATWPLTPRMFHELPVGDIGFTTVPLLNVWTMWWNADRLQHGFRGYWDAPIFYPTPDTFAFSEPQPPTVVMAPVLWMTGSRIFAYNLYLLLSIILNGAFAERLLKIVGLNRLPAVIGGMAMVLLPVVHWQLDVLQLVPLWGILWTWSACVQAAERPNWLRGVELGAAFSATFLVCGHHGLFLAVLLIGTVWVLPRKWFQLRTWLPWVVGAIVTLIFVGPMVLHMRHALARDEFAREKKMIADLSLRHKDYLSVTGVPLFGARPADAKFSWHLCPGWIKVGLALFAGLIRLFRRRWRRWTALMLLTIVLAYALSKGSHLRIGEWHPWWTLAAYFPGFSRVRNVFRFGFFVQMAVALLAAQALYFRNRIVRTCLAVIVFALGLLAVIEVRPAEVALIAAPDIAANQAWVDFIRKETPAGKAIACFPFPPGTDVGDFDVTTRWMYFSTFHGVPLINGYSGFFTKEYFTLQDQLNASLATEPTLKMLADSNVEFLVINTKLTWTNFATEPHFGSITLEFVLQDPVGIEIYRIRK